MGEEGAPRIAVIGAGLAGLLCARRLQDAGLHPVVFEKSRGLGGRLATRRAEDNRTFDHGAQYITARDPGFRAVLENLRQAGNADLWRPRLAPGMEGRGEDWMVGAPAMNALVRPLAEGLDVRLQSQVTALRRASRGWRLEGVEDESDPLYDAVVCAVPAPQAQTLAAGEAALAEHLAAVRIAPCWALMVLFSGSFDPGFDACRPDGEALAWIARNASKPGRAAGRDAWVVHASPDWSSENLELEREETAARIVALLPGAFGRDLPPVDHAVAHRWRYALTTTPLGRPYLASEDGSLLIGGDWCLGARVECAYESGEAMAAAVLQRFDG
ncbi:MAG TPA: FAD-binding protein [Kiloniellaceae bacterium]|nr:FAD-binding protein [Kiloniellaceae bacterium]